MSKNNLGDQIRGIVEDAMDSMNFSQLNEQIKRTVNGALDEVRKTVGPYQDPKENTHAFDWDIQKDWKQQDWKQQDWKHQDRRNQRHTQRGWQEQSHAYRHEEARQARQEARRERDNTKKTKHMTGSIRGTLFTIFGSIGVAMFGLSAFITGLVGMFTGVFTVLGPISLSLLAVTAGFGVMLYKGTAIRGRMKRYQEYNRILRGRSFCAIEEMADYLEKPQKYIVSDLRKMIRLGFFPEGHIDNKKTHFITTDETFEQYLMSTKSYEQRKKLEEEQKRTQKAAEQDAKKKAQPDAATSVDENSELYRTIKAGREYILEIRHANDKIPGEEISRKLDTLEEVTSKIFICVEQHPEKLPEIRKFMEYYLPTTLKLVNAYREFDCQPIQGENITSAKTEIENTLDTINDAFARLLDSLFEDAAMEVATDISVLNTLLAQEGLMKSDFK